MSKKTKRIAAGYIIGSLIAAGVSMILIPRIIETVSSGLYKKIPRESTRMTFDDWGPEIVKKGMEKENKE